MLAREKFEIIKEVYTKYSNKRKGRLVVSISFLCKIAEVSRSGYYNYFSNNSINIREKKESEDLKKYTLVKKAYDFKNRKKGARQIKMTLHKEFNMIMNLKSIRRIMKKYNLACPIRKANPYRRMMKATKEHTTLPNLLNRNFKQDIVGKVLLTDITYLFYGNGKKAYLSTIKDSSTNEILAYNISKSLTLDITLNTLEILKEYNIKLDKEAYIHSDQGVHYTSPIYQKKVKDMKLGQSMSRRGNCWDNAPQESFFGHFKDEAHIKECNTFEELEKEVSEYMYYYNNLRGQWNLKKMTPVEYRNHLLVA